MKTLTKYFCIFSIVLLSCNSKTEPNREEAFRQIKEARQYPKVIEYDLFCGDPQQAKKVLGAGLETNGLLKVQRTQKLSNIGSPIIQFTDKAQSYVLPTPEADKSSNIQKVKIGEEDLVEVTRITTGESGKNAVVEYTTSYKNLTPFSVLVPTDFKQIASRKANFSLDDEGWKLENSNAFDH